MADESSSAPETVTVEFSVGLADGKFKASAVVPAGQTNLTQILPVIQSLENSLIQGVTAQLAEAGHAVSCKAGCGACCRQIVPLSVFEAETLTAWIRSLPESQQEQLAQRFHQALLKLAAAGIIDRLVDGDWLADTGSARQLGLDYLSPGSRVHFSRMSPAPFTPSARSPAASTSSHPHPSTASIPPSWKQSPSSCHSCSRAYSTGSVRSSNTAPAAGFLLFSCLPG